MTKMRFASVLCLLVSCFTSTVAQQPKYPFNDPSLPMEKRIDNLLSLMTVEEKIACLGTNTGVPRLGVMSYGNSEGIHGVVQREPRGKREPVTTTQFPQPPGMGESWDPELVRKAAGVQGYEARFITQTAKYDRQILMLWGPQSDLARDPRWGRSEEVYGEDPFFNGTMAVAFIKGLQGRRSEVLAGGGAAQAFPGQQQRRSPLGDLLRFRPAALLGVLLRALPDGL